MIQSDECLFKRSKSEYTDKLGCTGTWEKHMRTQGEGSHLYSKARPQKKPTLVMPFSLQSSGRRGILLFKVSVSGTVLWHP